MSTVESSVASLFKGRSPVVASIYSKLLDALEDFGPVDQEPKKTSIHLSHGTAFAGVHPRASSILLNIRTAAAIRSPRIRKAEQISKNRYHNELILSTPDDIDTELVSWLENAYRLT